MEHAEVPREGDNLYVVGAPADEATMQRHLLAYLGRRPVAANH